MQEFMTLSSAAQIVFLPGLYLFQHHPNLTSLLCPSLSLPPSFPPFFPPSILPYLPLSIPLSISPSLHLSLPPFLLSLPKDGSQSPVHTKQVLHSQAVCPTQLYNFPLSLFTILLVVPVSQSVFSFSCMSCGVLHRRKGRFSSSLMHAWWMITMALKIGNIAHIWILL